MLTQWLIRAAAWLVPADNRDEWRREWLGELHASATHHAAAKTMRRNEVCTVSSTQVLERAPGGDAYTTRSGSPGAGAAVPDRS